MKRLVLGRTGVLAGLQLLCWGVFLRYNGLSESTNVGGFFLAITAVVLLIFSVCNCVLPRLAGR